MHIGDMFAYAQSRRNDLQLSTYVTAHAVIPKLCLDLQAPVRVVVQPLGEAGWLINNYNKSESSFTLRSSKIREKTPVNALTSEEITHENNTISMTLAPRGRVWVKFE